MALWLPSYRDFRKAVGQFTAAAAGLQVAALVSDGAAKELGGTDPWHALAHRHGIRLDGVDGDQVVRAASSVGLVSTYSAFDAFARQLRSDWHDLGGGAWKHAKGQPPLEEIRLNAPCRLDLGDEGCVMEYYRRSRNWAVHPSASALEEARRCFVEMKTSLDASREKWKKVGSGVAPSAPESLVFADVKLFARVALHVAGVISDSFDPGDEALSKVVPMEQWARLADDPVGQRRAAAGFLQTVWGIDRSRAVQIATIATAAS